MSKKQIPMSKLSLYFQNCLLCNNEHSDKVNLKPKIEVHDREFSKIKNNLTLNNLITLVTGKFGTENILDETTR